MSKKHTYTRQGVNCSEVASGQEKELQSAMIKSVDKLRQENPDKEFVYEKSISLSDCYILPDGGVIYLKKDGTLIPLVVSEKKYQKHGANAFERLWKNVVDIAGICIKAGLHTLPYAIFADGAAFNTTSNPHRQANNACVMFKEQHKYGQSPELLMRINEWTENEMYSKCLEIAQNTLKELA